MRRLARRVAAAPGNAQQAMSTMTPVAASHPAGTAATPMTMPMNAVKYLPVAGYPWGTAAYQDLSPVYSPDGALIAAYDSGSWGNLHAAGRK